MVSKEYKIKKVTEHEAHLSGGTAVVKQQHHS
jgi:hypothetical protein